MTSIKERVAALTPAQRAAFIKSLTPRVCSQYYLHTPWPKQQFFLTLNNLEAMYGGAAGGGKALPLDTKLATPSGWTTMGEVRHGDYLYDESGQPTQVLAVSEVMHGHECYRVTFSDHTSLVADAEHFWATATPKTRSGDKWKSHVLTTRQIANTLIEGNGERKRHSVPLARPLQAVKSNLPVDPYVLGLWLGDGDTRRGYVTVGREDLEIIWHIKECGYEVTQLGYGDTHYRVEGLSEELRQAGVIGTYRKPIPKRIPAKYMRSSVAQRRALLQGLVDSDGHVDSDVEITMVTKPLIDDIMKLLVTLGIKAECHESRAMLNGVDCGPRWRIKFMTDIPAARLERKARAQKRSGFRGTHNHRYIISVEQVESVPVKCVKVASKSHLYLAGEQMVPTHNSDALLMAALQYVDVPGYSALILRRTWPDLNASGAILDRAKQWLANTDARMHDGGRYFTFPSGARLSFGYLQHDKDKYKFQSAEYQFVGWDELTQFPESLYSYLFSRVRQPQLPCVICHEATERDGKGFKHVDEKSRCTNCLPDPKMLEQFSPAPDGMSLWDVPLRIRSATNPGGIGHEWVFRKFIDQNSKDPESVFLPASLKDNPALNRAEYEKALSHLGGIDRERLLNGDWSAFEAGNVFEREWFDVIDDIPQRAMKRCRYWDMAATEQEEGKDPDWTVGTLVSFHRGEYVIEDQVRFRKGPKATEDIIKQTAQLDGPYVMVRIEEEGGSAGKTVIDHFRRDVLAGYNFDGDRPTGSKVARATPFAVAAENGMVKMVAGTWNKRFLDECELFPLGAHDDQVDSFAGACAALAFSGKKRMRILAHN